MWLCKCECGNTKSIRPDALTSGATKSCGCDTYNSEHFRADLSGKRFGRLEVIKYSHSDSHRVPHYLCHCDCGKEKIISSQSLKKGLTVSCGCYHRENHRKHSMSQTRLFSIWHKMKERCYNENHVQYHRYGGRGITVCDEWKDNSKAFFDWALSSGYSKDLTLDRIDNDGNYSPDNCKWSTAKEQMNNRSNNRLITYYGKTHTLTEWSRIKGISPATIYNRLNAGWSIKKTFNTPIDERYSHKASTTR